MNRVACAVVASGIVASTSAFAGSWQQAESQPTGQSKTQEIEAVIYSTRGDEKVHVLAADDLRLLATIDAGAGLHELAIDSSGRYLMGSAYGGPGPGHQPADNRVVIIDLTQRKVHKTIALEGVQRPNDIAFVPGTTDAFVTAEQPQHVVRVNAVTGEYAKYPLKHNAGHMLAMAKDGKTVYVSHVMPGNLSVIDAASGEVKKTVKLPDGAEGMAVAPDGQSVWVASHQMSRISIVSTATSEVSQSIVCPGMPFRMKFAPSGKTVAISCPASSAIAFIDVAQPAKIEFVDTNLLDGKPIAQQHTATSIAFSADGKQVFAVCSGEDAGVIAVNVAERKLTARVKSAGPIADALTAGVIQWAAS